MPCRRGTFLGRAQGHGSPHEPAAGVLFTIHGSTPNSAIERVGYGRYRLGCDLWMLNRSWRVRGGPRGSPPQPVSVSGGAAESLGTPRAESLGTPRGERYARGMTTKIAVSLPDELVVAARQAVAAGQAASVSAFVADAIEEHGRYEQLAALLSEMAIEAGTPTEGDRLWAREALGLS